MCAVGNNETNAAAACGKSWRVLIVDDSEKTAKLIEAELEGKGFEILQANNVDEATRLIVKQKTRPDLVLLDVIMPGVDGRHFCRFVKSNEMFSDIKVVLCSSMDAAELEAAAESCGADGFVHKESILGKWVLKQLLKEERQAE
jgi:CheY-like chemotaxis protein